MPLFLIIDFMYIVGVYIREGAVRVCENLSIVAMVYINIYIMRRPCYNKYRVAAAEQMIKPSQ